MVAIEFVPSPRVRRVEVPGSASDALPGADYGDAFSVGAAGDHRAEHWGRRAFESGPLARRRLFSLVVWQGLLGLRLAPEGTADTVAGWAMARDDPETLVLRADGWMLAAALVVEATPERATLTTLLRYDRPPARAVWTALSVVHRALAPAILGGAARSLQRHPDPGSSPGRGDARLRPRRAS